MVSILSYVGRQGAVENALPVTCERRFFTGMAIAMALVCFAGFAPSYYLKAHFHAGPQLSLLLHLHGLAFTARIGLLVAQTSVDYYRTVNSDQTQLEGQLRAIQSQALQLANQANDKQRYMLAGEYYDVAGEQTKAEAARARQQQQEAQKRNKKSADELEKELGL